MNMHAVFSIFKTKEIFVLAWPTVIALLLKMPQYGLGDVILPPLRHRDCSPAMPIMQWGR